MSQHPHPTAQRSPAEPRSPRRDGRPWIWAVVGIVVLVGLFAFGAAAQSFGDRPEKAAAPKPVKTTTAPPKTTAPPRAAAPKIGSSVRDGQFAFVVGAVDCGRSTIGSTVVHLTADGKFCVLTVTVHNVGTQSRIFSGKSQKAYAADGTEFITEAEPSFYANGGEQVLLKKVSPGDRFTEKLVFDVPKSAKLATVELHDSPFSSGVTVSLKK